MASFRHLLERISRNRVLRRHLPSRAGGRVFYASPDAALRYLNPNLEVIGHALIDFVLQHIQSGDVVWDLGANVGLFAISAAHRVGLTGRVIAIEPDPFLASLLHRSAHHKTNCDLNVDVLCAAISDQAGIAKFLIANRGRASNSLAQAGGRTQAAGSRYTQYVPTLTLDDLLATFPAPTVLKIDVEGAEVMVLNGGKKVLSEIRPTVYVEVGPEQREAIASILRANDYALFDGDSSSGAEIDLCRFNTLALPREKMPAPSA